MLVCIWYTELTCIPYWASKTDIVGQVLGPSVCVFVCGYIRVCMWYTELTDVYHIGPLEQSSTDIVGQVPVCVCVCVCVQACVWRLPE